MSITLIKGRPTRRCDRCLSPEPSSSVPQGAAPNGAGEEKDCGKGRGQQHTHRRVPSNTGELSGRGKGASGTGGPGPPPWRRLCPHTPGGLLRVSWRCLHATCLGKPVPPAVLERGSPSVDFCSLPPSPFHTSARLFPQRPPQVGRLQHGPGQMAASCLRRWRQ